MKLHKFEVFVLDFDECGIGIYADMLTELDSVSKVFKIGTADVGELDDKHPLNKTNASMKRFNGLSTLLKK